jgi:anti-sigma factor RsiW
MTPDLPCPSTISIGAFLVGALTPTDRQELQAHLDDCEPCRRELVLLAQLPGLMHRHRLTVGDGRYASDSPGIMRGGAAPPSDAGAEPAGDGPEAA